MNTSYGKDVLQQLKDACDKYGILFGAYNIDEAWESCITIGKQWAWKPNDKLKTYDEILKILLKTAGGGGNLLLNVSPMLDGRIERRQINLLAQVGRWLKEYGDAAAIPSIDL